MPKDSVALRYAQSVFELASARSSLDEAARGLGALQALLDGHEELRALLINPGVDIADKLQVLRRVLGEAWSADLEAFLRMVLAMGRAAHLRDIVQAFEELVDAARGIVRVRLRSVHPLPDRLKTRLQQALERREGRRVELVEETDPALIGGLQVVLDHRMFDGSLRTQLERLRRRLKSVRVH